MLNEIIYEVQITLENSKKTEFESWFQKHIDHVLSTNYFLSAHWYQSETLNQKSEQIHYSVHYFLNKPDSLEQYLNTSASKMRAEVENKFGASFQAQRRVLKLISKKIV